MRIFRVEHLSICDIVVGPQSRPRKSVREHGEVSDFEEVRMKDVRSGSATKEPFELTNF
jgi:hypothetical protein